MPRTLILNNKNVVSGTNNARYLYKFPNSVQFKDTQIAVASVNMYYSWFSITSDIGNNSFQYVWYEEPINAVFEGVIGAFNTYIQSETAIDTYARLNWDGGAFVNFTPFDLTNFTQKSGTGEDSDTLVCSTAGTYTIGMTGEWGDTTGADIYVITIFLNGVATTITQTLNGSSLGGIISAYGSLTLEVGDELVIQVKDTSGTFATANLITVSPTLSAEATAYSGAITETITIPDGFYSVDDLNSYLQSQMVSNGHYLVDSNGDYVYYLELTTNASKYAVQLNSYPIPTALPSGYSNPTSITFPTTATTPQLIISSDNTFQDIIGFDAGTYPSSTQDSNYSHTSDYTPQVTPTQSLILSCSLLNNPYANPNTLLYSFAPTGTSFGSLISSSPNELVYVDIQDGFYPEFFIEFLDQNLSQLSIQDNNLVVMLAVKQKGE